MEAAGRSGKKKKFRMGKFLKCTEIGYGHLEIISLKDLVLKGKQGKSLMPERLALIFWSSHERGFLRDNPRSNLRVDVRKV